MNENLKRKIEEKLGKNQLFYVCRDIERAEGLLPSTETPYQSATGQASHEINIITNSSPYSLELKEKFPNNIILINKDKQLDTWEILKICSNDNTSPIPIRYGASLPLLKEGIPKIKQNDLVMVFKNTKKIEQICKENDWNLINPPAKLANEAEEKISQIEWLGDLKKYLPGYVVKEVKDIEFPTSSVDKTDKKFIIQFNHSHTGSGTILIESNEQLEKLKEKFPNREARIAKYIKGPLLTNNNIIWSDKILMGNISYQITGLSPFTTNQFAGIGNDWKLSDKILNEKQLEDYKKIVHEVGQNFIKYDWKGLFGIDIVVDEKTGQLYLLEINARQPASTSCESWLQNKKRSFAGAQDDSGVAQNDPSTTSTDVSGYGASISTLTTFDAHLMALLEIPYENEEIREISDGAQVILRKRDNTSLTLLKEGINTSHIFEKGINKKELEKDFKVIEYSNPKPNADYLRIESKESLTNKHNSFNNLGEKIIKTITKL